MFTVSSIILFRIDNIFRYCYASQKENTGWCLIIKETSNSEDSEKSKREKSRSKSFKIKTQLFWCREVNLNMDTQIPQEDEDNNNGSASDKSPSIPSTSINTHTESSTGSAELKCIIGHEIGEFQKSLNSEISTFIMRKDLEVKQYKSKIDYLEKMRWGEQEIGGWNK